MNREKRSVLRNCMPQTFQPAENAVQQSDPSRSASACRAS